MQKNVIMASLLNNADIDKTNNPRYFIIKTSLSPKSS